MAVIKIYDNENYIIKWVMYKNLLNTEHTSKQRCLGECFQKLF
jgi:hypothetical protein